MNEGLAKSDFLLKELDRALRVNDWPVLLAGDLRDSDVWRAIRDVVDFRRGQNSFGLSQDRVWCSLASRLLREFVDCVQENVTVSKPSDFASIGVFALGVLGDHDEVEYLASLARNALDDSVRFAACDAIANIGLRERKVNALLTLRVLAEEADEADEADGLAALADFARDAMEKLSEGSSIGPDQMRRSFRDCARVCEGVSQNYSPTPDGLIEMLRAASPELSHDVATILARHGYGIDGAPNGASPRIR